MSKYQAIITCRQPNGEVQTTAIVHGSWAVHLSIDGGRAWAITHVPSGKAVPRSHTELLNKAQAISAARRIDAELGGNQPRGAAGLRVVAIIHEVLTGKEAA